MSRFALAILSCLLFVSTIVRATDVSYCDNNEEYQCFIGDGSFFGWHIHSETHDLCDETKCPVAIGDFLVAHSQVLPGYTPPGTYSLTMKMLDGHKKELTCIKFSFKIGLGSSSSSSVADI
ncbi:hypothetical protein Bca52824_041555 [Brassica carinata]|uniref:MD-2-related lipid-recognition domain-containing protein n=1 Tax=Brassica carinata TaxID=52824 RepID=A0A8X7UYX8_BRACI|nr:hypothetical protein Bca52824_041555 [Brassica carinata]